MYYCSDGAFTLDSKAVTLRSGSWLLCIYWLSITELVEIKEFAKHQTIKQTILELHAV